DDADLLGWAAGINRQTFWISRSRPPRLTYINHKLVGNDGALLTDLPLSTTRVVLAAAALMDCGVTYMNAPPPEPGELFGVWDELQMGRQHQRGWLGAALGPAVRVAEETRDLLAELGTLQSVIAGRISGGK